MYACTSSSHLFACDLSTESTAGCINGTTYLLLRHYVADDDRPALFDPVEGSLRRGLDQFTIADLWDALQSISLRRVCRRIVIGLQTYSLLSLLDIICQDS